MLRLFLGLVVFMSVSCSDPTTRKDITISGKIIKLSVEPSYQAKYRIFVIGTDRSYWELDAVRTKLTIGERPLLTATHQYTCYEDDCSDDWPRFIKATIELPACASFRDTQKYVVKESSSGVLFGLVYGASNTESVLRDEMIIMPCLAGPAD